MPELRILTLEDVRVAGNSAGCPPARSYLAHLLRHVLLCDTWSTYASSVVLLLDASGRPGLAWIPLLVRDGQKHRGTKVEQSELIFPHQEGGSYR